MKVSVLEQELASGIWELELVMSEKGISIKTLEALQKVYGIFEAPKQLPSGTVILKNEKTKFRIRTMEVVE